MIKQLMVALFIVSIPVMGQNFESVRERADQIVKAKRADLKLERKEEKDKQAVYNWGTAKDGVQILFFQGTSRKEAIEKMQAAIKFLPTGPGTRRTDLGDEAYSWQSKDFAGFRFRKGKVFIDLVAPKDIAEDLARDLAQFVKSSPKISHSSVRNRVECNNDGSHRSCSLSLGVPNPPTSSCVNVYS